MVAVDRTILFVILVSFALAKAPNNSNFSTELVVPLITLLLTKYLLGDWDLKYQWTKHDIVFVLAVLLLSFVVVRITLA